MVAYSLLPHQYKNWPYNYMGMILCITFYLLQNINNKNRRKEDFFSLQYIIIKILLSKIKFIFATFTLGLLFFCIDYLLIRVEFTLSFGYTAEK